MSFPIRRLTLCLALCWSAVAAHADSFWTRVQWTSPDGLHLVGNYHAADRPNAWTWVLLHGYASNKGEWGPLADELAKAHQGVFVYDLRGHGESMHTNQGSDIDYRTWTKEVAEKLPDQMPQDLAQAIDLLHTRFQLNRRRIAVGGASFGANIAIAYAASHPSVPAVILLSPGMNFGGIAVEPAFQTFSPRPILIAASPGDTYSYQTVQYLSGLRHDSAFVVLQGSDANHGVNMFKDPAFLPQLLEWMKKAMSSSKGG